jgi:putative ABC transport system permease protein
MLISGAGLLLRSVLKFSAAPLGFDLNHVVLSYINLPEQQYPGSADKLRLYEDLRAHLDSIPGVEGSAISIGIAPFGFGVSEAEMDGRTRNEMQDVGETSVSPDYFGVLRIALRRGRLLNRQDGPASAGVAVVNEKFVSEYFPGVDPVGKRLRLAGKSGSSLEIVGVVDTEKQPDYMHEMSWHEQPLIYRPIAQKPFSFMFVEVRTHGDQAGAGRAVERAIGGVDKEIPVGWVLTQSDVLGRRFILNPAVAAGRIADRPTAQPLAKMAVLTGEVSCAAVGNCRQQRLDVAECG